jgi:hypothetical protein
MFRNVTTHSREFCGNTRKNSARAGSTRLGGLSESTLRKPVQGRVPPGPNPVSSQFNRVAHDSSNSSPPFPMRESSPTKEMKPSLV